MAPTRFLSFVAGALILAACSSNGSGSSSSSSAPATVGSAETPTTVTASTGDAQDPDQAVVVDDARCAANQAAGEIRVLTGFSYAAAASIIDVLVADAAGYYDALCLDVTVQPGLSYENYPLVASNQAQFSSGGSFAEVASFVASNDAELKVIGVAGNVPVETLIMKPDRVTELSDLEGQTIGVQGAVPRPVAAMLAGAGLTVGEDVTTVPLAGFDPLANLALDEVAGISGYRSNEIGQLDAAGYDYVQFNPADYDVPGSFGVYYTNTEFADAHPTAVQDFMRATLRGLDDAISDPAAAVDVALAAAEADGNPFFFTPEGELFRWQTEAQLVRESTGDNLGVPDRQQLQTELSTYAAVGVFDGDPSLADALVDPNVTAALYDDDGNLIWGDADTENSGPQAASADPLAVVAGEPFPDARCERNQQAGTITFLTGFDYAAAASIVEVIEAEAQGFYDALCLDVEIVSSFSTANYPLVAGGQAQFASGGSFSETVAFALANEADLRVVTVSGPVPIDTLIVKPEVGDELADLAATTIGVKGKLPASIEVMLNQAGLIAGQDYETVPVDGFDPVAHMSIDATVGVPGWRSNEPGRLEREGVPFIQFDAAAAGIPGSFGTIFTSADFIAEHPTAAEDFVRATLYGLQAVLADPESAADNAVALVEANGNPNFLSAETERFRAVTEAEIILESTAAGVTPGTPQVGKLQAALDAYAPTGLFGDAAVPTAESVVASIATDVTDPDTGIIWPG